MKVGDLVKFYSKNSVYHKSGFGIVLDRYCTAHDMWMVHWFDSGETNPCISRWLERVNEGR